MKYLCATISFTFNQSSYEQYQPSTVDMVENFQCGMEDSLKELSEYDRMRFLKLCYDKLFEKMVDSRVKKEPDKCIKKGEDAFRAYCKTIPMSICRDIDCEKCKEEFYRSINILCL